MLPDVNMVAVAVVGAVSVGALVLNSMRDIASTGVNVRERRRTRLLDQDPFAVRMRAIREDINPPVRFGPMAPTQPEVQ